MMKKDFLDRNLALETVRVTEIAALASSLHMGKGNEKSADQSAVNAMRDFLNELSISGKVVIGEGERDKAPMLFIGEEVGKGGPKVDIALDPLEGTNITAKGKTTIVGLVDTEVQKWNSDNLLDFNKPFRHSDLLKTISNADDSILSCSCNVSLAKYITPTIGTSVAYTISFNNTLYYPHSGHNAAAGGVIASTGFYITGDTTNKYFWDDDGAGNLRRYYLVGSIRTYVDANAGTVDYTTGLVTTKSISISSIDNVDNIPSRKIRIVAVPNSKDIIHLRNQLLEIDFANTDISGEVDTIAVAGQGGIGTYNAIGSTPETKSY